MTSPSSLPSASTTTSAPAQVAVMQPCMSSSEILRGQKAVEIHHNGATYKLQATRLGKLILTK